MKDMMFVIYTGKNDCIQAEYNGVKYSFSKEEPISEIPVEVYAHIMAQSCINNGDIVPYNPKDAAAEDQSSELAKLDEKLTKSNKKNAELVDEVKKLKGENKKLKEEIKKIKKK